LSFGPKRIRTWALPSLAAVGLTLALATILSNAKDSGQTPPRVRPPGPTSARTQVVSAIGLVEASDVEAGYVVRMAKAYPVYDDVYRENVEVIRAWFEQHASNIHPVGRNGMHKYNNQDHSMYTAMLTVENLHGANHDIWSVNVEEEYHESDTGHSGTSSTTAGTGRDAPTMPKRSVRS